MNPIILSRAGLLTAALITLCVGQLPAQTVLYGSVPNASKVRVAGTSTVHDWAVEGASIGGSMELPADFPMDASKPMPAKLSGTPKVEVNIFAKSLHNLKNYDGMDDIMYEKLLAEKHQRISYRLTELKPGKAEAGKLNFDSKGDLVVAGVTNSISMPVTFEPQADNKLKVSGATTVKMSDFKIDPPAPKVALGLIKTGDEVKLSFEWVTRVRPAPAAK